MDASARSFLLELMAKSKKGLLLAEQLCSQARAELDACQQHANGIEKIYSKLCFVSSQLWAQMKAVESLLRIAKTRASEIALTAKGLDADLKSVNRRMEQALQALRSRPVDSEIQKTRRLLDPNPRQEMEGGEGDDDGEGEKNVNHGKREDARMEPMDNFGARAAHEASSRTTTTMGTTTTTREAVLYDFLDEESLQTLQRASREKMETIRTIRQQLEGHLQQLTEQRQAFNAYLASAIPLDHASATTFAREKIALQEQQTTTMAESLVSTANHYDQVAQILIADEQPLEEEMEVLKSDTAVMLVIIEELEESLEVVRAISEEIGVREHLYTTAHREAVAFSKTMEGLEPLMTQLVEALKVAEGLEAEFDAAETIIAEINSLAIWYEEFHNSYGAMTLEIVRRNHIHREQKKMVADFIEKMNATYKEELTQRAKFAEQHGRFLPVDLCPPFADQPVQYEVIPHGDWRLPMPSRPTLQLIEQQLRELEGL
ncbi:autophagy protein 17 [Actinomortierella ambigua]|nr:autophagy protein 17 [Actinomortierella ambigua]